MSTLDLICYGIPELILVVWLITLTSMAKHNHELIRILKERVYTQRAEWTITGGTHTLRCGPIHTLHVTGGNIGMADEEPAPIPHRMTCGHDGLDVTPYETVMGARVWKCPTCGKVEESGMVP